MNREWAENDTTAWMARVFEACTSGPSLFDPSVFFRLGEVAREGLAHDRLTVVTYDVPAKEMRIAARAWRDGPLPPPTEQSGMLFRAPPDVDSPESQRVVAVDHPREAYPPLRAYLEREGLGSCRSEPLPLATPSLRAWLLFGWKDEARASKMNADRLDRFVRLLRVLVPAAHDHSRATRLATMLDRLPHAVFALGASHAVLEANETARAMFETAGDELRGKSFESLLNPASQAMFRAIIVDTARNGTHVLEVVTRDGPMLVDAVISNVEGDPTVTRQVYLQDARRRIADETELESRAEALAFLRELAEKLAGELNVGSAFDRVAHLMTSRLPVRSVAIGRFDGSDRKLSFLATRGFANSALLALRTSLFAGHEHADADGAVPISPALQASIGADRPALLVPLRHADQTVGIALFAGSSARLSTHTRELLLAASRTIAVALYASIEFEEVARLAAERRQLLDSIPTLVFRLDARSGATQYANAAIEAVLGYSVSSALGYPGIEGLLADEQERFDMVETRQNVMAGAESRWIDRRFTHADGRQRVLRMRLYPVHSVASDNSADISIEGIAQDVTDEIESRKQLIQADRLASLGMLAAGVAHEINNPTAFISLGVQQLSRLVAQMPEDDESLGVRRRMGEVLTELADGVQRIVQIVGELKLFARIPESAFSTPVDVNRLITSAVTLARSELRNRARVEVDLGELPPLPGDHARLGQVFVNLLINAAQAIPPGDEERNRILVRTRAFDGYVQVDVSDTGVGIPRENLGRIFDPFFTTKAPGEGTGLGLAISFDLVKRAGGTIDVQSEPGRGTEFSVKLPVRQFVPPRGSRPQISAAPPGGRLLVVEDEQHLGVAVARALASRYMVELAPDAATALERIESGGGVEYDAVLCDLRMPGMDGRELFHAVRTRWPAQAERFIFLTGAAFGSEYEPFIRQTDRPVIEKPFDMVELEEIVARVVAEGAVAAITP